jgi:predicted Zn-dependent protease
MTKPTFRGAMTALRQRRYPRAVSLFAALALAGKDQGRARVFHALALWGAGRWADAARAFESIFAGQEGTPAVLGLFALGHCLLESGDPQAALMAMSEFLERSTGRHPLFGDAVRDIAQAWALLGDGPGSASLRRANWPRARVIARSRHILQRMRRAQDL